MAGLGGCSQEVTTLPSYRPLYIGASVARRWPTCRAPTLTPNPNPSSQPLIPQPLTLRL